MSQTAGPQEWVEEYQTDGLSNVSLKRVEADTAEPEFAYEYDDYSGLLDRIVALPPPEPPPVPFEWRPDTTYNIYDDAGNVRLAGWRHYYDDPYGPPSADRWALRGSANFFGADGKLMVSQVYRDSVIATTGNRSVRRGIWEEYWYDALGRRVLVRRRGGDASSLCYGSDYCESGIERFVWDGDQVLWELRAPGGTSDPLDDTPPYGGIYTQFGRVGYTHGPGLDAPLDLFRLDWNGATKVVLPHRNWRGAYDAGSDTTGTVLTTWDIQFPANYRNAFHVDPEEPFRDLRDWFGSLIQDKADESGLIYMRNRYYDPATGKFTQEDPIGLAGGLNLYGFAGGDPINFSDPFGLCENPPCFTVEGSDRFKRLWQSLVEASSRLAGFVKEAEAADKPEFVLRETEESTLRTYGEPGGFTEYFDAGGNRVKAGTDAEIAKIDSRVSAKDLGDAGTRAIIRLLGGVPTFGNVMVHEFSHGILAIQGYESTERQARASECAIMRQVPGGRCTP